MMCRTLAIAVVFCTTMLSSAVPARAQTPIWADEFEGTTLNPANWEVMLGTGTTYGLPAGWGNNEWQYYTDSRDNSALDGNGHLVITALTNTNPANICTAASPTGPGGQCFATSARRSAGTIRWMPKDTRSSKRFRSRAA